jgi:hypothetical protein
MATKIMYAGGAVVAIGAALLGIGLAFFIAGVTWPAIAQFEGRTFATVTQVQWEGAILRPMGLYIVAAGAIIARLGAIMGFFAYSRRRSETI